MQHPLRVGLIGEAVSDGFGVYAANAACADEANPERMLHHGRVSPWAAAAGSSAPSICLR
jgi:hypothetical protein